MAGYGAGLLASFMMGRATTLIGGGGVREAACADTLLLCHVRIPASVWFSEDF